uniref:Thiamine biosynthetic bifunctional enzyme n=1 Tax=Colletotrichum fructicola (strain Nara gc5) TaxID=1213859 RepID=L2G946_COLFN
MLTQVQDNPRFASYCPYCQTSSNPATSVLPPNLKDPPAYTSVARSNLHVSGPSAPPPPYTATTNHDTVASLSLRYGGRKTVLIPGEYYAAGISLSPRPIEGEEEELRKSKIRRFMTGCKVSDYDVAVLYLEQAGYDLEEAMEAFAADEVWERDHPVQERGRRGKDKSAPKNRGPFWRGSA